MKLGDICPTCGRRWNPGKPGKTPLAQALFARRVKDRTTMRDAADEAGIDLASFHRAEKGRTPSVENAVLFARWLGVSLDSLFSETSHAPRARSGR